MSKVNTERGPHPISRIEISEVNTANRVLFVPERHFAMVYIQAGQITGEIILDSYEIRKLGKDLLELADQIGGKS